MALCTRGHPKCFHHMLTGSCHSYFLHRVAALFSIGLLRLLTWGCPDCAADFNFAESSNKLKTTHDALNSFPQSGVPAQFTLQTCDSDGRIRCIGGDNIDVIVTGKSPLVATRVRDSNDGRYTVTFTAKVAGIYLVEVSQHALPYPAPSFCMATA